MPPAIDVDGDGFPDWLITAIVIGILLLFGTIIALRVFVVGKGCWPFGRPVPQPDVDHPLPNSVSEKDDRRNSCDSVVAPLPYVPSLPYSPSSYVQSRSPTAQLRVTPPVSDGRTRTRGAPTQSAPPHPSPAYLGLGGRIAPMVGFPSYRSAQAAS